ncbi:MAG: right-handed parallel beta-helix repeat-containing protein [Actinobacteria bacterium]|nr:right-handed parallel beta-helix repeat-containing protein [Actinomycetota bacterium]
MGSQHGNSAALKALKSFSILIVLLLLGLVAAQSAQAASAKYVSDSATGGDCTTFGIWDAASKTCTMTANVNAGTSNGIEILSNGITLDGNGFAVIGSNGYTTGVPLSVRTGVTVKNLTVSQFNYGIYLLSSNSTTLTGNTVSNNAFGVYEVFSNNSQVFNNNFISNGIQAYVTGGSGNVFDTPSGGNHWSNYSTPGQGCDDNNGNFVCDVQYTFTGGIDHMPWRDADGWKYTPPPDSTPPNITSVLPAGIIETNSTTISIDYNDPGSNINLASISVTLDGVALSGCTSNQSNTSCLVTGVALGAHSIGGTLEDNRGNVSLINGAFNFVDTTAPAVGTVLPAGTVNSTSTMITAGYSDGSGSGINPATVSVTLDGSPLAGCAIDSGSLSCAVSGLSQGNHTAVISVSDVAGNTGTGTSNFAVDSLPPSVSAVSPSGTMTTGSATISASYSDSQSPINTGSVVVTLDGTNLSGCTVSATGVSCQVSNLTVGAHTIGGSVSDTAGNTAPISGSFVFSDTVAPTVASILPSGRITSNTATLSASYSDGTGSGIDTGTVAVLLDGSPASGCVAGAATVNCNVSGLADGSHTLAVSVNDRAGNTGSGTGSFTVDTTGPVVTPTKYISASATGGDCPSIGVWDDATKTCFLTGDYYFANKNGIQITANGVTLDGNGHTISGSTAFNSGVSYTVKTGVTVKNLTVKSFNYGIYQVASNGNTITGNTILSNKNGIYMSSSSNNTIYGNSISSSVTQQIVIAGGAGNVFDMAAPIGGNYWSNFDTPAEGCNDLNFDGFCDLPLLFTGGQDNLPRVSPPNQWLDITPPNVTSVTPSGTINVDSTNINISYFDIGSGVDTNTVVVRLDGTTLAGCAISASSASCPVSGLAQGAHTISGSLADTSGNSGLISGSFMVEILTDVTPPAISSVQPSGTITTSTTNVSANYTDSGSGINSATVAVYLDGSLRGGCSVTASSVNCPVSGLADGAHGISVSVSDNAGNTGTATGSFTVSTVAPDTTPPSVTSVLPSGIQTSTSATITAYLSDAGSGVNPSSVVARLDGVAMTGCTATASSVSCPKTGIGQGAHAISVTASDNAGNSGTGTGSFTVDSLAPSVTALSPTGALASPTTTISASLSDSGTGINSATAQVYVEGGTVGTCNRTATSVSCQVSGMVDGIHNYTVTVSDMAGNTGSASASLNIDTVAPAVSNIQPSGTITTSSATISAYYSDTGSGLNISTAVVTLDGTALTGCTRTFSGVSCPATGLTDGIHNISVSVQDNITNMGTGTGSFTVTLPQADTTAPTVTNVQPGGTIATGTATISAYYSDSGSGINSATAAVTLDGTPITGCVASASAVSCDAIGLSEGAHNITVSVADNAGNTGTGSGSFVVDSVIPVVSNVMPNQATNSTSATVSAYFNDGSGTGIDPASVRVYLDDVLMAGCAVSTSDVSCAVSGLTDGYHSIRVDVLDNAGNSGHGTDSFLVDTTIPVISDIQPSGTISTSAATVSAYLSDSWSDVNDTSVVVMLDSVAITGCTATNTSVSCPVTGLVDGYHTIDISVADNTGNTGTGTGSFTVDTTVPDTTPPVINNVMPSGTITTTGANVSAYLSDTGSGINTASVSVQVDSVALTGCTVSASSVSCAATGLAEGAHNISVTAADNAGNSSTSTGSFTVDSMSPTVSGLAPTGLVNLADQTITASYSDSGTGIDSSTAQVYMDSGVLSGCTATATSISCPAAGLAEGAHSYTVSVRDTAGNTGSASASFTVDSIRPTAGNFAPQGYLTTTSATITAYISDSGSGIDTAAVWAAVDGVQLSGCTVTTSSISCPATGLAEGHHIVSVRVQDMANNGDIYFWGIDVDSLAPSVTGLSPYGSLASPITRISASLSDSGSGIDSATAQVYVEGGTVSNCSASATSISCDVAGMADGVHYYTVSVSDLAGNTGTASASLHVDTVAPTVSNIQPSGTITTDNATISAYYSDAGVGLNISTAVVTLDGTALTGCTRTFTGVSCPATGLADGVHNITVSVLDNITNVGTGTGSFTVAIPQADTTAPSVTNVQPTGTVTTGTATISADYSDAGSGINAATARVYLDGTALTGCTATATSVSCPASGLTEAVHNISVSIADNAGNTGTGTGSFTVNLPDTTPPSVTNILPSGTITTSAATVYAYYSDTDSGINSATAKVYLDGTALTGCTATATGVSCPATGLANGVHNISVRVADNAGNTGTGTGSFTVSLPSCTTDYTDASGASISVYSDSSYTTKVCQQTQLTPNTNYYVQLTHPTMNLSSEGTNRNRMRMYNLMGTQVNYGDGTNEKTFTQQSGGAPYRYRTTFRTPSTADIYTLEPSLRNNAQTKQVTIYGWMTKVGNSASYVATYSDAAYSVYTDTFAPGATVYVQMYSASFSDGTPTTSATSINSYDFAAASTVLSESSVSRIASKTYRTAFTMPSGTGDRGFRLSISSGSTLARPEFLLNRQ